MHFGIEKDVLVDALRDVINAIATKVVQPILSNVMIESLDSTSLRFVATDLDLTIQAVVPAVVYTPGSITLPGKKLLEIVSKLPNELVSFQINTETQETAVSCKKSRFSLLGLPALDFPKLTAVNINDGFSMPADVLRRAILQTSFAAAAAESSSILGGVYLSFHDGKFEATATDGSRLAHRLEELAVAGAGARVAASEGGAATATLERQAIEVKAIVPAKACAELLKIVDGKEGGQTLKVLLTEGHIYFGTQAHLVSTRLIAGEYPRYHELFPKEYTYVAEFNRQEAAEAVQRVATMSDERTNLIKLHFEGDSVQISANTPDLGKAAEELTVGFQGQVLDVAVNVRYVLDVLNNIATDSIRLEMTGALKPLIFKAGDDEHYKYLLMPVQAK